MALAPSWFTLEDLKAVDLTYEFVDLILWASADDIASGTAPVKTVLGPVAAALDRYIEECGNKFSKQAFDNSSGRIPKALRPTIRSEHVSRHELDPSYTFRRVCIGQQRGWTYDSVASDALIYQPTGTPEGVRRVGAIERSIISWMVLPETSTAQWMQVSRDLIA